MREEIEREVRYANITVIEGIGASQYGIGMVSARLTEMILRDEGAVIPIGCYNPTFGVTLSLPSVVGREGVRRVLEPEMSAAEQQGLQRSAMRSRRRYLGLVLRNFSGEQLKTCLEDKCPRKQLKNAKSGTSIVRELHATLLKDQ
jgi:hypothetical protein